MHIDIRFSIWIASKTRWTHLTKLIAMPTTPRVGEYMKFLNAEQGDYFAWQVTEVTYREGGPVEISTELLDNIDQRGYSFETEAEFDEYLQSYLAEGWTCEGGIGPNRRYKGNDVAPHGGA
jgi:hypothetical protein